ncbi:DinB family protein [Polaromonas aquatica]|uniref:DinB family protein n=1 Tax=Polaromonas aquatica TaxID=332657 RepID=UPI003D65AA70
MQDTRNIRMLTRYTAWANDRLLKALGQLPPGEVTAPRATSFGNMIRTLNHAYVVDLIWQAHLEGRPHGFTSRNTDATPTLAQLQEQQQGLDGWYIRYADGLTAPTQSEIVHFNFVDGGKGAMTRGDMLLHIVNHKTFHRGYVADMMYQVPARPPSMDLPVFLRDAAPDLS